MHRRISKYRRFLSLILILQLVVPPTLLAQQPLIPGLSTRGAENLPELAPNVLPEISSAVQGVAGLSRPNDNHLVVHQDAPQAIIDWHSFNIGAEAWTHFDQQGNTDWTALNRIYDQNPSLIFGRLTGDGKIFLVNQNGILFGPDSQIDVHSLAASSLGIAEDDFLNNMYHFQGDDDCGPVANYGAIQAGNGGFVYLAAPEVVNAGSIDALAGQVTLAAGTDVEILLLDRGFPYVYVMPGENGTATNAEDGRITADAGLAGIYGRTVNQKGYIRSITAISNSGRIELHASDKVLTGEDSVTATPVSANPEEVHSSFELNGGKIHVAGLDEKYSNSSTGEIRNRTTSTGSIEHRGEMTATSGEINMSARDRIYLEAGSRLDVSGEWVATSVGDTIIQAQLNSVEMKNDEAQRDGVLQGETVEVLPDEGSTIGDLTAHLSGEFATAREMATSGGDIALSAPEGDIIVRAGHDGKSDAVIDFSGGGTVVEEGAYNTSKLLSGNKVYDISDAPDSLQYDRLANYQEKLYERYGLLEQYEGLYYGGANTLAEYRAGYIEGDDAGKLALVARGIVLNGVLDGSATAGIYQTETRIPELMYGSFAVQTAAGTKAPRGGELFMGPEYKNFAAGNSVQYYTDEVLISKEAVLLPEDFSAGTDLLSLSIHGATPFLSEYSDAGGSFYRSVISADRLNQAGLSNLIVQANTKITVERNASLKMQPGGLRVRSASTDVAGMATEYWDTSPALVEFSARQIELNGTIQIPEGRVDIFVTDTVTSDMNPAESQVELNDRALLAGGANIDVSGDRIDNSLAAELDGIVHGYIDGGIITVQDNTRFGAEVILSPGALLDVSGGYTIDAAANIEAGDAGAIDLSAKVLVVEADLRGHSLVGAAGGQISLHADTVSVQSEKATLPSRFEFEDMLPDVLREQMILTDDQLAESGFAHIVLKSFQDFTFASGTRLSPSTVKMASPTPDSMTDGSRHVAGPVANYVRFSSSGDWATMEGEGLIDVPFDYLGDSSITAMAGEPVGSSQVVDEDVDTYTVLVEEGARIEVAPGGSISLSGLLADIGGTLRAMSGTIKLEATRTDGNLILRDGSNVIAAGYNRLVPESTVPGAGSSYELLDGGTVSLTAKAGNIITEADSVIDISGSAPVENLFYSTNGTLTTDAVAADAGNLVLTYANNLTLAGAFNGRSQHTSTHGASLTINQNNLNTSLTLDQAFFNRFADDGFDALGFSSLRELVFSGDIDVTLGRKLTLDAPLITGLDNPRISFRAPSILLANTQGKYGDSSEQISYRNLIDTTDALVQGAPSSSLLLTGDYIDVAGSIALSGFGNLSLDAVRDIRLSDDVYHDNSNRLCWKGLLRTPGDLTLKASRIYPTTRSDFTLASDSGRITILPGESTSTDPIAYADGSLTLAAAEIDHQGYLAAPMGRIIFRGSLQNTENGFAETVFLADGSVTTVAADAMVQYGQLDDIDWTTDPKPTEWTNQESIQSAYVETEPVRSVDIAGETVVMQTGAAIDLSGGGTLFAQEFLPGINGLQNPFTVEGTYVIVPGIHQAGEAVYLEGGNGLPEGTYSLLPESYAFMEGAYVIQHLGSANAAGLPVTTEEGFTVVTGFETITGTQYTSAAPQLYSIRKAADVIRLSDFSVRQLAAGSGGFLDIRGTTTVLDGTLSSRASAGYAGGAFSLSGAQSAVVRSSSALGTDYAFGDIQGLIDNYRNTAQVLDTTVSDSDLSELNIGTLGLTETVTIAEGATLEASTVRLSADDAIQLAADSTISAAGPSGYVAFHTPEGILETAAGSRVVASQRVDIEAQRVELNGVMASSGGTLGITADRIVVTPEAYTGQTYSGLYLSENLFAFDGFAKLELHSDQGLTFLGETTLVVDEILTIDAPSISGIVYNGVLRTEMRAESVHLLNTGDANSEMSTQHGRLIVDAADDITIGHGDVAVDGYGEIELKSGRDVAFSGEGSLTASGDLTLSAGRITTDYFTDDQKNFEVADFRIQAGSDQSGYRNIFLQSGSGQAGTSDRIGGSLDLIGNTILMDDATIDIAGGWVSMTATGAATSGNAITLSGTSWIDVSGKDMAPGGRVSFAAEVGNMVLGADAVIDVSAGFQGDAGEIAIGTPLGTAQLNGSILGHTLGLGGKGGGFSLDSGSLVQASALFSLLAGGGFDREIDLRVRVGGIDVAAGDTIRAYRVKLTADSGDVVLGGAIDASGATGGAVELNAGSNLILLDGSLIDASATSPGETGGTVSLNAAGNQLTFAGGATIDVSGADSNGGEVHFRARQTDTDADGAMDDVLMDLAGTVLGAERVTLEGVRTYEDEQIDAVDIDTYHTDAATFLSYRSIIQERMSALGLTLSGGTAANVDVVPGIEVQSTADLTLAANWDLTEIDPVDAQGNRQQTGRIALRAAGDLTFSQSLVDHPTELFYLNEALTVLPDAWGISLVAGGDLDSADLLATLSGGGDLIVGDGQVIYTENNTIRLASGRDTILQGAPAEWSHADMINPVIQYNIATYNGDIQGYVGRDMILMGGSAIQSAVGDIDLAVERDLHLELNQYSGCAIRTTGTGPLNQITWYDWNYGYTHSGGDIKLDIGGRLRMGDVNLAEIGMGVDQTDHIPFYVDDNSETTPHLKYWDNAQINYDENYNQSIIWSADYGTLGASDATTTAGVATMGGGSIDVVAGNRVSGQIGTFKDGDLSIFSNSDISGYYQAADGNGAIIAMGNVSSPYTDAANDVFAYTTSLAIFDAQVTVSAGGSIDFGTIFNPTFPQTYAEYSSALPAPKRYLDYSEDASVALAATRGGVSLSGTFWSGGSLSGPESQAYRVLPPAVELSAGGDILFGSEKGGTFILAPSAVGNLAVHAAGDIAGYYTEASSNKPRRATLRMSDIDPDEIYRQTLTGPTEEPVYDLLADETREDAHATGTALHEGDSTPIAITAGGDIRELKLVAAKQTVVYSGGDISGLYFFGQNIDESDVTAIQARGDILFSSITQPALDETGLINAGTGLFLVKAGGSIDLGSTQGVQAVGNAFYSALNDEGGSLAVIAGATESMTTTIQSMTTMFGDIREAGMAYSELLAEGDVAGAAEVVDQVESQTITPLALGGASGGGNIEMTSSSIQTSAEKSDIFILAGGQVNVGGTTIPDPLEIASGASSQTETGIFTTRGGAINVLAMGDVNVNESRIMTFRGGDITVWSDQGDINAGRGSKTAVNAGSPKTVAVYDSNGNIVSKKIVWEPPSVGSGIRTLTYDPDGSQGVEVAPDAGDAYLFAPQGIIDAGEAGIAGSNVILGATEVLNAQNIDVTGASVGIPQTATGPSVSTMAGAGTVSETSKIAEESAAMKSAEERFASRVSELSDQLVPKWIAVEVVGFDKEPDEKNEE